MNLESIKNNKNYFTSSDLLRLLLAVIFLSAGIFRIFNPAAASRELKNLQLPLFLTYFLIIFEIGGGGLLLLGKYLKIVYGFLIGFLLLALVWGLIINSSGIIGRAGELFIFQTNPTDFFLHLVFLVIIIVLYLNSKTNS